MIIESKQAPSDLRYRIFGILFLLNSKLEALGNSEHILGELSTKQWFLLLVITAFFDDAPTISQVSQITGTSHQNVKVLASNLEKKGFLTIKKDENDKRILRLHINHQKQKEYDSFHEQENSQFIDALFQDFDQKELFELEKGLTLLVEQVHRIRRDFNE